MDLEEFSKLRDALDQEQGPNALSGEFGSFIQVWVKSRMPEAYSELQASFEHMAPELYARQQEESAPHGGF